LKSKSEARSGTLTEALVAAALAGHDPGEARRAGSRALFDYLACLAAGRRVVPEAVGDAGAAAALDRDDVHWPSLTHPGTIVWTVLGETGVDGPARWRAAHAGYEVTARLGRALGADHRRYWHATATAGTVGGAVAAALALGTDPVAAAGHAISVAGGSIVCLLERSGTRLVHREHAAAAALRCARMAVLPASRAGLEHERGLFAAMGGSPAELLAPGTRAALSEISLRRHATTGFAQAAVDAALELGPVEHPGDGSAIVVEAPAAAVALAGDPAPRDAEQAWWSIPHAVAVTLLGLDLQDATLVEDAGVAALRGRIELRPGLVWSVTVGGRRAERAEPVRASDDDLVAKWRALNPDDPPPTELLASRSG